MRHIECDAFWLLSHFRCHSLPILLSVGNFVFVAFVLCVCERESWIFVFQSPIRMRMVCLPFFCLSIFRRFIDEIAQFECSNISYESSLILICFSFFHLRLRLLCFKIFVCIFVRSSLLPILRKHTWNNTNKKLFCFRPSKLLEIPSPYSRLTHWTISDGIRRIYGRQFSVKFLNKHATTTTSKPRRMKEIDWICQKCWVLCYALHWCFVGEMENHMKTTHIVSLKMSFQL